MAPRKGKSAARRCRARQDRRTVQVMLRAFAEQLSAPEVQAELQALKQAADEEWLRLTGFSYPASIDEYREAGIRLGLTIDRVECDPQIQATLLDVAKGNYHRREDEARAREQAELRALAARRAAEAAPPVVVDDPHGALAKRLRGTNLAVLWLLYDRKATSASSAWTRSRIAESLRSIDEADAKNALAALKHLGEKHVGRPLVESDSPGSWLTADGCAVAGRIAQSDVEKMIGSYPRLAIRLRGGDKAG